MVIAGQTITIVNNSGKIVSTSKHLVNIFNEAKTAYSERKAEIRSQRRIDLSSKDDERKARRQLEALAIKDKDDDARSRRSSRHGNEDGRTAQRKPAPSQHSRQRPPMERGYSDSFYENDRRPLERHQSQVHRPSPLRTEARSTRDDDDPRVGELARRHTDGLQIQPHPSRRLTRSSSLDDIDMDLAYGELPPPLPERKYNDEVELRSKMSSLQKMLDEFNCLQHTVTSMIDNLQKNPDALAAVALTLGEISNIAMKMAPGALTGLKGSFPAIIALLASPQFAIAAGVGVGVTVIALGGYKIIKKLKAGKDDLMLENGFEVPIHRKEIADVATVEDEEEEEPMDELREIGRIEQWRRGIADAEADSLGTSVDGEFLTPHATRTLVEEGRLTEADLKPAASTTSKRKKHRSHKAKSEAKSEVSSKSKSKSKSSSKSRTTKKEPSGLRMLFSGRS